MKPLVALTVLVLALCASSVIDAALVTRNYRASKSRDNVLNFKALLPKDMTFGMQVYIVKPLPTSGTLFALRGNGNRTEVSTMGEVITTSTNIFFYRAAPQSTYPASDSVRYNVMGGNPESPSLQEDGVLNISIVNNKPVAYSLNYKTVGSQPRTATLRARDFDEPTYISQEQFVNGESVEIVKVEVVAIDGLCKLYTDAKEEIPATGKNVQVAKPYRLTFVPPEDSTTFSVGTVCKFTYRVQDKEGAWSNEAVVTMTSSEGTKPNAFSSKMTARVGVDGYILLTLQSSSGNGRTGRTFYVKSLPEVGRVFLREAEGKINSSNPLALKGGSLELPKLDPRDTQLILAYQPPPPKDTEGNYDGPEWVNLVWFVTDAGGRSDDATVTIHLLSKATMKPLMCGVTTLDPVFANKPFRRITLNYTIPEGGHVQRISLVNLPTNPIGDFYAADSRAKDATAKKLGLGNYFNDARQHLFFKVRKPAPPFQDRTVQEYQFRVKNYNKQSCTGTIRVVFRTHDAPVATNAAGQIDTTKIGPEAKRTESCKLQHYTLLPLRGLANYTLAGGPKAVVGARIVDLPTYGKLYRVVNTLPFNRGKYAVLCDQKNCSVLRNGSLESGSVVRLKTYDPEEGLDSDDRIYVLYRAPNVMPQGQRDTFTYRFVDSLDDNAKESTALQRVNIRLREASYDTITFWYDKKSENRLTLKLSNKTKAEELVEILPKRHGHGHDRRFKLYQYGGADGNRSVLSEEVASSSIGDLQGEFVKDEENRVVLVPEVSTHRRRFTMHIRRFPKKADGTYDVENALTYRIRIKRRNHAPTWAASDCSVRVNCADSAFNQLNASTKSVPFVFVVNDEDNDSITFVVKTPPKFGTLTYERFGISGNTLRTATKGTRIQMKKATNGFRDTLFLYYNHKPSSVLSQKKHYPLGDSFEILGDDGQDKTEIKKVSLWITADDKLKGTMDFISMYSNKNHSWMSSSLAVGIAVGVAVVMMVAVVTIVAKRREARRKYMQLPVVIGQPHTGTGSPTEMKPHVTIPKRPEAPPKDPERISLTRAEDATS